MQDCLTYILFMKGALQIKCIITPQKIPWYGDYVYMHVYILFYCHTSIYGYFHGEIIPGETFLKTFIRVKTLPSGI